MVPDSKNSANNAPARDDSQQRLMILVGDADADRLVRLGERMTAGTGMPWAVAHVTTRGLRDLVGRERLQAALGLAEHLGAEVVALTGHDLVAEILAYARDHKVTQIVLGRSRRPWRWLLLRTSLASALVRHAPNLSVTIAGELEGDTKDHGLHREWERPSIQGYVAGVLATAIAAGLSWILGHSLSTPNLSLVFLMAVLVVAVRYGRGAALATAVLSFLTFNFLFTEPRYTFRVASREDVFTIFFFLIVALVAGQLGARLRRQMLVIRDNARLNSLLYEFSRRLNTVSGIEGIAKTLQNYLKEIIGVQVAVLLDGKSGLAAPSGTTAMVRPADLEVAELALENDAPTGRGTEISSESPWYFVPMLSTAHRLGVIAMDLTTIPRQLSPMHRRIVFTLRDQASVALERQSLAAEVARTQLAVEAERLRAALLSSVSHDLRTPLVSIIGAASSLLEMGPRLDKEASRELLTGLLGEAERLNRFVQNLLDMTRLGYGAIKPRLEWHDLHDIVGEARRRLRGALSGLSVDVRMPEQCLIYTDAALLEQVLVNLSTMPQSMHPLVPLFA